MPGGVRGRAPGRDAPRLLQNLVTNDVSRLTQSRDELQRLGYDVEWHTYPMEHTVSTQEVDDLNAWLLKVLSAP